MSVYGRGIYRALRFLSKFIIMKNALTLLLVTLAWGHAKSQSSGWIPFEISRGQICLPVMVNGHPATARLINYGTTRVDKDLVATIGLEPTKKDSSHPSEVSLDIGLGNLSLQKGLVANLYLHIPATPPYDIFLGDEPFQQCIVDIDFPNKKIAFFKPDGFTPPEGAVALNFGLHGESRAIPLSVEGGPELSYWVYLGDPAPMSIYASYFQPHGMLQDRAASVRMGGGRRTPPEAIATVKEARVAGLEYQNIPSVFPDDSVTGEHPAEIAGHIGLALCARARVIFDYAHDRLYWVPGKASAKGFPKDYTGLVVVKSQDDYVVKYVSPHSPAMKAGLKVGDTIIQINHQPVLAFQGIAWQSPAWSTVQATKPGATYTIILKDSSVLKLTTAEFF